MIVVFDLDGTLIDSVRDIGESASELVQEYGAAPLALAEVVAMIGDGAGMLVRRALERSNLDPEMPGALKRYLDIYDRRLMNHTVVYAGLEQELARALAHGPLAVLTNKPLGPSIGILETLGLRGFFSRVIGGDSEYGRKPDPAGLLELRRLEPGAPMVMVGDSPVDARTAAAAECPFIFARYGFGAGKFGSHPPETPFAIDHPRDLARVLATINLP